MGTNILCFAEWMCVCCARVCSTLLLYFLASEVNKLDQPSGLFQQLFPNSYYYYCDSKVTFEVNASRVKVEMWKARLYPFPSPAVARSKVYLTDWPHSLVPHILYVYVQVMYLKCKVLCALLHESGLDAVTVQSRCALDVYLSSLSMRKAHSQLGLGWMLILPFEALFQNFQMLQSFIYVWYIPLICTWLEFFMVVHDKRPRTLS